MDEVAGGMVEDHYTSKGIAARILAALGAAGGEATPVTPDALAPLDHFHGRGLKATLEMVALLIVAGTGPAAESFAEGLRGGHGRGSLLRGGRIRFTAAADLGDAGLRPGDRIIGTNEHTFASPAELTIFVVSILRCPCPPSHRFPPRPLRPPIKGPCPFPTNSSISPRPRPG